MADLVSVIIPTHNRCERLRHALESVRMQGWKNTEIIVVDDASGDGTAMLVEKMSKLDTRIRYIRNDTPQGGGGARNTGIAAAHGKYVAFLDDDDQWLPNKLERQYAVLAAHPEAAAVSCSFVLSAPGGADRTLTLRPPRDLQQLLRANCLGGASVCFTTRAHLLACGGFDPVLRSGQDWDLWLKLYANGPVLVCAEPLVRYETHGDQRITGNLDSAYRGRRRIHLRYKPQMNVQTRRHSLCELAFFRRVLFRSSWVARLGGLLSLVIAARGANKLRFPYRLAKLALGDGLRRSAA